MAFIEKQSHQVNWLNRPTIPRFPVGSKWHQMGQQKDWCSLRSTEVNNSYYLGQSSYLGRNSNAEFRFLDVCITAGHLLGVPKKL